VISRLNKLTVPDNLPPEIIIEGVKHPEPIVTAVIFSPPAAEGIARRILTF
jgi:hypothetical protein